VECIDCHRSVAEGIKESLASIKTYCIQCHDESYGDIAERWKSTAEALVKKTEPRLEKIREEIQKLERMGKHTFAFTKSLGDADHNFTLVKNGKGVHNVEYAEELIESVNIRLDQLEKELAKER
jgi:putative sterol carrier protein